MRELKIIYRSESHAAFWILAEQAGMWEKNGLRVDTSPQLNRERAVDALKNGNVDLISGNHHNLYARRARNEDFVHLGQLGNLWTENHLVVKDGIRSVQDLRGKRIAIGRWKSHAGLNVWLFMKQEGLDLDKGDFRLVETHTSTEKRWKGVLAGEYDAVFLDLPHNLRAISEGAREITVRAMPMVRGVTLTTTMAFVKNHEDDIRRLIRGSVETVHFFLTQEQKTKAILRQAPTLGLNDQEVNALYAQWAGFLERKLYPTPEAVANVFALAVRLNPEIADMNPLIMWNTHYLRELDDSGFIDNLYR